MTRVRFICALAFLAAPMQGGCSSSDDDAKHRPTVGMWINTSGTGPGLTMVSASLFPDIPNFTCDSWCYESDVTFVDVRALDGGKLELRHRLNQDPNVLIVTTVTPEPGAVEFAARLKLEKEGGGVLPSTMPTLNLCWQLRHAPGFASMPEPYPAFVTRCFIFTREGRTFLDKTVRRKIPVRAPDDPRNNPPWVQIYTGVWQQIPQVPPNTWADFSTDRYTTPIMGAVSRDGNFLAAIANDSALEMSQAWHDCMHNNPQWLPADAPPAQRVWRLKIYVMKNDPDALLERVVRDFPAAAPR